MRPVLALSVFLACAGCGPKDDDQVAQAQTLASLSNPAYRLTAEELGKQYRDDPARADVLYKGKVLAVTGICQGIRSALDTPHVTLAAGEGRDAIECDLGKDQQAALALVKPGQTVTVTGVCDGKAALGGVRMKGCVLRSAG